MSVLLSMMLMNVGDDVVIVVGVYAMTVCMLLLVVFVFLRLSIAVGVVVVLFGVIVYDIALCDIYVTVGLYRHW